VLDIQQLMQTPEASCVPISRKKNAKNFHRFACNPESGGYVATMETNKPKQTSQQAEIARWDRNQLIWTNRRKRWAEWKKGKKKACKP